MQPQETKKPFTPKIPNVEKTLLENTEIYQGNLGNSEKTDIYPKKLPQGAGNGFSHFK